MQRRNRTTIEELNLAGRHPKSPGTKILFETLNTFLHLCPFSARYNVRFGSRLFSNSGLENSLGHKETLTVAGLMSGSGGRADIAVVTLNARR